MASGLLSYYEFNLNSAYITILEQSNVSVATDQYTTVIEHLDYWLGPPSQMKIAIQVKYKTSWMWMSYYDLM